MVIRQYGIFIVNLDPTIGHEIKKTRPCVVVSPDEMNDNLATVIIAPVTSKQRTYPTRVQIRLKGRTGYIVLDQIRTIDKSRLIQSWGRLSPETAKKVKGIIREMLVE
jgi:mRNA interferase MazF